MQTSLVAAGLLAIFVTSQGAFAESLGGGLPGIINDFDMSACPSNQGPGHEGCLLIHAKSAEGTSLKRLFSLDDVKVASATRKTERESWQHGYVDFELKRLVVWKKSGNARTEKVFDF